MSGAELMKIGWVIPFVLKRTACPLWPFKGNGWTQQHNLTIVSFKNAFLRGLFCDNVKSWKQIHSEEGGASCVCMCVCVWWHLILAVVVACVRRYLWDVGLYFSPRPLNWWYSCLNVHMSSKRHSLYRDGSKLEYSHQCVTNSTSMLQTNMLFSRWLPEKKPHLEQSI